MIYTCWTHTNLWVPPSLEHNYPKYSMFAYLRCIAYRVASERSATEKTRLQEQSYAKKNQVYKCHDLGQHSRSFLLVVFRLRMANSMDWMVWPLLGLCLSWAKQRVKHLTLSASPWRYPNGIQKDCIWGPSKHALETGPGWFKASRFTIISRVTDSCFVPKEHNRASWKRNGSRNCIAWIKSLTKHWDKSEAGSNQVCGCSW